MGHTVQAVEDTTVAGYLAIVETVMTVDMVAIVDNQSVKVANQPAVADNKVVH